MSLTCNSSCRQTAGRYLKRLPNRAAQVRRHLDRSDRWREPVMLLGEHLCFRDGDPEPVNNILDALVPSEPPEQPAVEDWRAVWMAGDLLMLYRRALQGKPTCDARIVRRLADLLEAGALTPRERAAAGQTLAVLGDPRPGVLTVRPPSIPPDGGEVKGGLPDLQCCYVPPGPFVMGSTERGATLQYAGKEIVVPPDPQAFDDESPVHIQDVPYGYWMVRYPVTNAQFDAFVADEGYTKNCDWRTKAGWGWRKDRTAPDKYGGIFDLANHPAVMITWYEAHAVCNWLTQRWRDAGWLPENWQVRLPTEAEWEKAARGGLSIPKIVECRASDKLFPEPIVDERKNPFPHRVYPWEGDFDVARLNCSETRINTTSAVGAFPGKRSLYGVLDMSGNVWEWCVTQWVDNYGDYGKNVRAQNVPEGDAVRVVRGGSFSGDRRHARAAFRFKGSPNSRVGDLGFRVVVAAAPIDSGL